MSAARNASSPAFRRAADDRAGAKDSGPVIALARPRPIVTLISEGPWRFLSLYGESGMPGTPARIAFEKSADGAASAAFARAAIFARSRSSAKGKLWSSA